MKAGSLFRSNKKKSKPVEIQTRSQSDSLESDFIPRPFTTLNGNPIQSPQAAPILQQQQPMQQPVHQTYSQTVVSPRPKESFIHFRRPVFKRVIAVISANVNGQRVHLKTLKVPTIAGSFRFMKRAFLIDLSKAYLLSNQGAHIMYDFNYSEPVERTVNGEILQTPILLGDTVHYSKEVDMIQNQSVIEQVVRAVGKKSGFDMMTIMFLLIGVCIGVPVGIIVGQRLISTVASTSTVTSTTSTAVKMLVGMFLR